MVAEQEENCVLPPRAMIDNEALMLKPIELVNIGHLQPQSTFLNCPACADWAPSVVHLEPVTCLQRFLALTDWCKSWAGRHDINHYCSKCGCYIGRYVAVDCMERCIARQARRKAAHGSMALRRPPIDIAARMQSARERAKAQQAQRAKEAAEAPAEPETEAAQIQQLEVASVRRVEVSIVEEMYTLTPQRQQH